VPVAPGTHPSLDEQGGAPNPSEPQPACALTGPVNCSSGALWEQTTDISEPEPGDPLALTRTYSSNLLAGASWKAPFGYGWSFTYGMSVTSSDAFATATVHQEDGSTVTFTRGANGSYAAPPRVLATLTRDPSRQVTFTRSRDSAQFVFDTRGRLIQRGDLFEGRPTETTTVSYPTQSTIVVRHNTRTLTFAFTDHHVTSVTDSNVTDSKKPAVYFTYEGDELTGVRERDGTTWIMKYEKNDSHRLTELTESPGEDVSIQYNDATGQVQWVRTQGGPATPAAETDWSFTGPAAATTASVVRDPLGRRTGYTFDGTGRLRAGTAALGDGRLQATTTYSYANPDDPTKPDPLPGMAGLPATVTDPARHTTSYRYDTAAGRATGHVTQVTNPLGHATTYQYDTTGLLTSVRLPGGDTTTVALGSPADGAPTLTSTDGNGVQSTYQFDPAHPAELGTAAAGATSTTYTLSPDGDLTGTTENGGWSTTLTSYTPDGQLQCQAVSATPVEPGTGCASVPNAATYDYDQTGMLTGVSARTSENRKVGTQVAYCRPSSSFSTCQGPAPSALGLTASAVSVGTTVTDPVGYRTTTYLDAAGRQLGTARGTTPQGTTQYDLDGEPTVQTDAAGNETRFSYDPLGRITTVSRLVGSEGKSTRETAYTYYPDTGYLESVTTAGGRTVFYTYDAAGETTGISYPSLNDTGDTGDTGDTTAPPVSFDYNPNGERVKMTVGGRATSYRYDCDGRLTAVLPGYDDPDAETRLCDSQPVAPAALPAGVAQTAVLTGYDGRTGQVNAVTYPGGRLSRRDAYVDVDAGTRRVTVSDWIDPAHPIELYYDPNGQLAKVQFPSNVVETRDANNVVVTAGGCTVAAFGTGRNEDGQVTTLDTLGPLDPPRRGSPDGHVYALAYSTDLGRLTGLGPTAAAAKAATSFAYDPIGDVTAYPDGTTLTYTDATHTTPQYRVPGELQTRTVPSGRVDHFGYDTAGERTTTVTSTNHSVQLRYDQAGRLADYVPEVHHTNDDTPVHYTYDGDGLLATRTVNGVTSTMVWDQSGQLPLLLSDGHAQYVYGPDGEPLEEIIGNTRIFLITDLQGSVRLLAGQNGATVGAYSYSAYGHIDGHWGAAVSALGYDGQYTDPVTGFQYLRGRYYDPVTTSFLTPDPQAALSGSPYGFAGGDPLDRSDPTGQFPRWLKYTLIGLGAAAVVASVIVTGGADLPEVAMLAAAGDAGGVGEAVGGAEAVLEAGSLVGGEAGAAAGDGTVALAAGGSEGVGLAVAAEDSVGTATLLARPPISPASAEKTAGRLTRLAQNARTAIQATKRFFDRPQVRAARTVARQVPNIPQDLDIAHNCVGNGATVDGCVLSILSGNGGSSQTASLQPSATPVSQETACLPRPGGGTV
jgi:RHS repeat-associated protein